jgi:hypothetical protein
MRSETFNEEHLLDFYNECRNIREHPSCDQCKFKDDRTAELADADIDLADDGHKTTYPDCRGYLKQTTYIKYASNTKKTEPSCWYCDRLSDTIIALEAPKGLSILSGDKQSYPALAGILRKPLEIVPSFDELREADRKAERS